ncbi:MAG: elongation factor 1-beta [Thermoplasmatota archaeon]
MGDVMIVYKIMPEDPEADLGSIKEEVKKIAIKHGELRDTNEEKVAFGLKAIIAKIVLPDEGGIVDKLEEELNTISGIQSAESVDITLV